MTQSASTQGQRDEPQPGVLDRMSQGVRERLSAIGQPMEFGAGATILREGGDTPFLGVLESGRVALRLRVPEWGDRLTIVTVEPGELLGWSAVVAPYRATVDAITITPSRLMAFEATQLRALLAIDCEVAAELLPLILASVSQRLGGSWHQLLDVFGARTIEPW